MSDPIDLNDARNELLDVAMRQDASKRRAADNVPFFAGECDVCAEESARLVQCMCPKDGSVWACAPCRDKHKLPKIGDV